jgi:hypothetical protein
MAEPLSADQSRLLRLIFQRLHPSKTRKPDHPINVFGDVFAVQAQDLQAACLSVGVRSTSLTASQIERARHEKHSIAWTWALRGTLHLLTAHDARWLIPLLGQTFIAGDHKRMQQLGWDKNRTLKGLHLLQESLGQHGVLERPQVVQMLEGNDLPHQGQAPVHLLFRAAMEGMICIGPERGKTQTFVSFTDWLGPPEYIPLSEALAKLAQRYLQAYAPASVEDLAYWSGLKMTEARLAWDLIAGETVQVDIDGQLARMLESQLPWLDELRKPANRSPVVNLLPRFDTFLMGYADRSLIVEKSNAKQVNAGGGIIRPVLLVDGRAVATWKMERQQKKLKIQIRPFKELPGNLLPFIREEVAAISRFIGEDVVLA